MEAKFAAELATAAAGFAILNRMTPQRSIGLFMLLALFCPLGCSQREESSSAPSKPEGLSRMELLSASGMERVSPVSATVLSGGEPHGEESFAALAQAGVRTVVSVDGARPDVETARRHGLQYVHVPIGYNGISDESARALTRVVRERPGLIYVHCHHGQHRGPAAAAIAAIAAGQIAPDEGVQFLEKIGTGKQYEGLWRDVAAFVPPGDDVPLPELCETVEVASLTQAMVDVDRSRDHLRECRQAGWSAPQSHPDIDPYHEALMLVEGFRESRRHLDPTQWAAFGAAMVEAESLAEQLQAAVAAGEHEACGRLMDALDRSCKSCHAAHRDRTD